MSEKDVIIQYLRRVIQEEGNLTRVEAETLLGAFDESEGLRQQAVSVFEQERLRYAATLVKADRIIVALRRALTEIEEYAPNDATIHYIVTRSGDLK